MEARITHVQTNISGIASMVNDIIDTQENQMQDTKWIKDKLAEIEDPTVITLRSAGYQNRCSPLTYPHMHVA